VYATRPATFDQFRWRLLHIAEERVGKRVRRAGLEEDSAWQAAMGAYDGAR
jgi:hypothetical protein